MGSDRPRQKAICDASGFEYYMDELVKQWDGMWVHPRFCDRRNPQDFLRGVREHVPSVSRPKVPETFVNVILSGIDIFNILTDLAGNPLTSRGPIL